MKVFRYFAVVAIAFLLVSCSGEKKEQTITLNYANFAPASTFVCVQMERWADEVHKRSNGKITIKTFPAGTLLGATDMYDGVAAGQADIGNLCTAYQPGRFPITNALSLPLGFQDAASATKAMQALYANYAKSEYEDVQMLTMFSNAPSNIMSAKPIRDIADMKGMNLRASGGAAGVLKAWGANQIGMPMSDVPEALQKGVVEGLFTSLEIMKDNKFAEQCKFVTMTNQVVYPFVVVMNKEKFNGLAPELQKILTDLSVEQAAWTAEYMDKHVKESMEWSVKEQGVEVITLSAKNKRKLDLAAASLIGDWAAKSVEFELPTEEILATLQSFSASSVE